MIAALILGSYALLLALLGPRLLSRWPTERLPRLTVVMLQVVTCSFLTAATTAGLALGLTLLDTLSHLDPEIDRCADQLPINDDSPVGPFLGWFGLIAAGTLLLRVAFCMTATFYSAWRTRRKHIEILRILARADEELGVLVLDHDEPGCYCLPGRPGTIVITSSALTRLSPSQLGAVLAHERAHLAGRHHFAVAFARAIHRTAPRIRLLGLAEEETRRLVEFIADDAAVKRSGTAALVSALAVLGAGAGSAPGFALGIGIDRRPAASSRVTRLYPQRKIGRRGLALGALGSLLLIIIPVLLAAISVVSVVHGCPPDPDGDALGLSVSAVSFR
ncbi:M56 family metallopeptidase [Catenulispora sp. NL8]|uniref:M56 family metallopeptidase n=1 Tax=Catenulispora pinistramenti TaxID=2705254 RepID=A0ABS5L0S3_9ACTN|nr:M56 family metallopeptidase [Catenulispora pinistramenti]MBS2551919.1 M56 family metallopeptidase [Catenulispora pinistramenti]